MTIINQMLKQIQTFFFGVSTGGKPGVSLNQTHAERLL